MVDTSLFPYWMFQVTSVRQDLQSFYLILNDLYEKNPNFFADEPVRHKVVSAIREVIDQFIDDVSYDDETGVGKTLFFSADAYKDLNRNIVEIFKENDINPLKYQNIFHIDLSDEDFEVLKPFADLANHYERTSPNQLFFARDGSSSYRTAFNDDIQKEFVIANRMVVERRFDYIVTGNVINSSRNLNPLDTLVGVSMLLRFGGVAFHLSQISDISALRKTWEEIVEDPHFMDGLGTKFLQMGRPIDTPDILRSRRVNNFWSKHPVEVPSVVVMQQIQLMPI